MTDTLWQFKRNCLYHRTAGAVSNRSAGEAATGRIPGSWRLCSTALLVLALAACRPAPASVTPEPPAMPSEPVLALVNGRLIDGTGSGPLEDAAVIIQGDRIVAVGPRGSVRIPAHAEVLDVQGATILPGFFNAHVHGAYDRERLEAWAQAGVTTVRDLHTSAVPPDYALRDQVNRDPRYARLVVAGNFITTPEGYPIQPWGLTAVTVTSPGAARQAAGQMLDSGADLIKTALDSGRIFAQAIPTLSDEELAAMVDAAHRRGTRVSVHVTVSGDLERAVDAGVDDIAHMIVDHLPDELVGRMVAKGIYWVPTLELWKNVGHGFDSVAVRNLEIYAAVGGSVALGTDFEGYYTPFQLGMPMIEMQMMRQAGMTPIQIIVAGTRNGAHVCNLEHELGTLEAGKIADLLVVRGDPLQDIQALASAEWVIHNGVVIRSP